MIDLELERRDFKKTWMVLGGHFKYLVVGENQAYHLTNNAPNLTPSEKELTLSAVNTAWAMWLIQARAKQAEIDSLKAQLAKVESGEFVVVPAEQLYQWGHMANYAQEYSCPECFEARGYAHNLACEINEYLKPVDAA